MTSTVSLKITGLSALNVAAIEETLAALLVRPGMVSIDTTKTTAVFEVTEPDAAAQAVAHVAANLPGRGHPRASLHSVRRKLETASRWYQAAESNAPQPQPQPDPQPVEWERALMADEPETAPADPSSWVIETYNEEIEQTEPTTVTVSVSSTAALVRTLETAGFTVFAQRFPAGDTVSYIQASLEGSSLTFRRPNADEPTPARTDDFVKIDAESYRYLADAIGETMTDPDQWDGDDAEPYILVQYVKWLAKGKPVDEDGYPDKRDDAAAGRPDFETVLTLVRSAFELADGRLYSCDDFELSEHGTLERVRDGLAKALSALTGRPEPEREPHEHHFPLPADAETDPAMEPADCACGLTYAAYSAAGFGTASVVEMDVNSAYPTTAQGVYGAWQNAPDDMCRYSMAHALQGIQAVTVLDCGPIGQVPACQTCADFYNSRR